MKPKWNRPTNVRDDGQASWNMLVDIVVKGQKKLLEFSANLIFWFALSAPKPSEIIIYKTPQNTIIYLKGRRPASPQILNHLKIGLLDVFTNSRKIPGWKVFNCSHVLHLDQFKIELQVLEQPPASTPSTSATRSTELVMLYKWMIGSCDFQRQVLSPPWLFHHGIDNLEQLGRDQCPKAPEESKCQ